MSRTPVSPRTARRLPVALFLGAAALTTLTAASAAGGLFGQRAQALASDAWSQAEDDFAALRDTGRDNAIRFWTRTTSSAKAARRARERAAVTSIGAGTTGNLGTSTPVTDSSPVLSSGGRVSSNSSRPRLVNLPLPVPAVDKSSAAYTRFKGWVDSAVAGNRGYGFSAAEAALMYRLSPEAKYCTLAIQMVEEQVTAAESAIAGGGRPEIAGDSYLEVGPMIADVASTLTACAGSLTSSQRTRWAAYAEQAVWNVWNYNNAKWGTRSYPWSGWSVTNPGNNYYYSFVEATMYWALASGNNTWFNFLRDNKLAAMQTYFSKLPGGGSSEGTGYGTSHMRLFSLYRIWRDATGYDLANANSHASDSIPYWIHATVPTMDRFAPIGDQARSSIPELYDYHRRLVLEARSVNSNPVIQNQATWWLNNISIARMGSGFNYRYDLLPAGPTATVPTDLIYHARGAGHLFARTGWTRDAMWVAIVAGPYNESHAHQDQGSFTLFSGDWLAVTANIWSHSGINQGTDVHNLVRFVRNGTVARQCESTTKASTLAVTPGSGGAFTANANLTPSFCNSDAVTNWQRNFTFANRRLTVRDTFSITSGTTATFQVNVPVAPTLVNSREATAGRLRVRVLEPANATINSNFSSGKYVEDGARYRIDVQGGTTGYVVELSEI
ncbi:MAG TPA: hypothetical protein VGE60_11600 [Telluria sp.]